MPYRLSTMFKKLKQYSQAFFHFSSSERDGLLAIVVLIFLFSIMPRLVKLYVLDPLQVLEDKPTRVVLEKYLSFLQEDRKQRLCVDINTASVQQIAHILGRNEKLAYRIIRYREKLGGFVSLDQYSEVYGMPSYLKERLIKQTMILENYVPKQISLRYATFQELVAHPYISPAIAKAIIAYRRKHAQPLRVIDLKKLPSCSLDWIKKMQPYLMT